MAIFAAAPLYLYDIAIFDTENIFSRIMTDDGQTTQKKPLRHITPGQENIETAEDSPRKRRNLRIPGHRYKTGDMRRRGDSYIGKKFEKTSGTLLGCTFPQLRIRPQKWNEKQYKNWKSFFLLKHFIKLQVVDFVHFVESKQRLTWEKSKACKERKSRK